MKPTTCSVSTMPSASAPLLAFEEAFSVARLNEIYEDIRKRRFDVIADRPRILTGADRIRLDEFERDRRIHLRAIERKVLQGRYTFSPFLGVDIPKPGSKETRPISISTIRDTIAQRAAYGYLYHRIEPLLIDAVFGYRVGRSAHDAIRLITTHFRNGRLYIFDADVTKFFDSVDHQILLGQITALNVDPRMQKLVFRFLRTGRVDASELAAQGVAGGQQQKLRAALRTIGVPQGGVLSGLLSNLYLAQFDTAVANRCSGYVRYADDFVICCETPEQCAQAYDLIVSELSRLKLALNETKTRKCVAAADGIDFLGFRLDDHRIRVRGRNIHKFKDRVKHIIHSQRVYRDSKTTLKQLVRRLNYKISGPNEEQQAKLRTVLGVAHPHRRCWVGFFRVVTDIEQIRRLDRWLRREVARFMWNTHRTRVKYKDIHGAGLLSLVGRLFRARLTTPEATSTQ